MKQTRLSLVLLVILASAAGCLFPPRPPSRWLTPRVHLGAGFLRKRLVFNDAGLLGITDIAVVRRGTDQRTLVCGSRGTAFLDPATYRLHRRVFFDRDGSGAHRIVRADAGNTIEFLGVDRIRGEAVLFDERGRRLWARGNGRVDDAKIGDLDGDGHPEFVLSGHSSREIEVFDRRGREVWSKEVAGGGRYSPTELILLDTTGNSRLEIVYIDGKSVRILDAAGNLLSRQTPRVRSYVNALYAASDRWSAKGESLAEDLLVVGYHEKEPTWRQVYRLLSLDAREVVREVSEDELWLYRRKLPVRFNPSAGFYHVGIEWLPYQGTSVGFTATRLRLRVYDDDRRLVYDETIAAGRELAGGEGAASAAAKIDGEQAILVGFGTQLWEYSRSDL